MINIFLIAIAIIISLAIGIGTEYSGTGIFLCIMALMIWDSLEKIADNTTKNESNQKSTSTSEPSNRA